MITDDFATTARAEAERQLHPAKPLPDTLEEGFAVGFKAGAEWARSYLSQQEPDEDEVEAAWDEWNRHLERRDGTVYRCYCGAPGFWGSLQGHQEHALWHALSAARNAREDPTQ